MDPRKLLPDATVRLIRPTLAVLLTLLMAALSMAPGDGSADDTVFGWAVSVTSPNLQNAMHVVLYGLLTVLWIWTLHGFSLRGRVPVLTAVLLVLLFGALMELAQVVIPGRFASLGDMLLNVIGTGLGAGLAMLVARARGPGSTGPD
ncbi:MAG: VanZ family protein [Pseudomonadales bacterium]